MSLLSGKAAIAGHRGDGVLQGVRPLGAAALRRGHPGGAGRRGPVAGRRRRPGHLHDGQQLRDRAGPRAGHGRPAVLQPDQLRRRCGVRHRAAGGDGRRDRRRRGGGLLPRLQRALGPAVRAGAELGGAAGQHQRPRQRVDLPARPVHAGGDGGDAGAPLHARVRRHLGRLRRRGRRRPQARRHQPGRVLLRPADHARGPPGVPDDRRPAAAARLLPGERRRGGDRGDLARAGRLADAAAGLDRGGGAGECGGPVRDDVVLPRRHRRARDGRRRPRAVAPVRAAATTTSTRRCSTTTSRRTC